MNHPLILEFLSILSRRFNSHFCHQSIPHPCPHRFRDSVPAPHLCQAQTQTSTINQSIEVEGHHLLLTLLLLLYLRVDLRREGEVVSMWLEENRRGEEIGVILLKRSPQAMLGEGEESKRQYLSVGWEILSKSLNEQFVFVLVLFFWAGGLILIMNCEYYAVLDWFSFIIP
jgi:hypothetical protein